MVRYTGKRMEEPLDESRKTPTGKVKKSLNILEDMSKDFDSVTVNS
jgi:hypothetical protein